MRFPSVASFFDRTAIRDAYTKVSLGKGQLDLFDDSKRDGVTVLRRVLSTKADWNPPLRGVVELAGASWMMGNSYPDQFYGATVRKRYILHRSEGLCQFLTGYELLTAGSTGMRAHASKVWVKDTKDISTTSEQQSQYVVYAPMSETLSQGLYVRFPDGTLLLARNCFPTAAGFRALECSELEPTALTTIQMVVQRATYDPVTETYAAVAPAPIPAVVTRFLDDYEFHNEKMSDAFTGDLRVRVRAVDAPQVRAGDTVALNAVQFNVLSVDSRVDSTLSLHIRPAT